MRFVLYRTYYDDPADADHNDDILDLYERSCWTTVSSKEEFAACKQFCDDTNEKKERAVKEANGQIHVFEVGAEKHIATAAKFP